MSQNFDLDPSFCFMKCRKLGNKKHASLDLAFIYMFTKFYSYKYNDKNELR